MDDDQVAKFEVAFVIRILRIIVIALMAGVLGFLIFVLVQGPGGLGGGGGGNVAIGIAIAAFGVVSSFIVPRIMRTVHRKNIAAGQWQMAGEKGVQMKTDAGRLAQSRQMTTIVACALLEGAAFYNVFDYWQRGSSLSLAIVIVLLVLMSFNFPSTLRWETWLEDELRSMREQRGV